MTRSDLRTATLLLVILAGCNDPFDPGPTPAGPIVVTVGSERVADGSERDENILPDPPSATLRAPGDDRIEEVDPDTGLPRPQ